MVCKLYETEYKTSGNIIQVVIFLFYANNLEKVRVIITPIIEDYKSGKITYAEAEFNARNMIYQSVNPHFNPDVEYMKDPLSRDIPSVDNSLFILARKLILESK